MTEETAIVTTEPTPMSLLQQAMSQNVDPDRLGKLLDLQERWERNQAIQAYSQAMNACQSEMPIVLKDKQNEFTKARYATLEAVIHTLRPIWTKHGFSISFNEQTSEAADVIVMRATVRHTGGYSEEFNSMVPLDAEGAKGGTNKTRTQAKGSTLTYARRYLTLMIFNVAVANEDLDGNPQALGITEEQVETINNMIATVRESGLPFNYEAFLKWAGVPEGGDLGDIFQSRFLIVVNDLNRKISAKIPKANNAEAVR